MATSVEHLQYRSIIEFDLELYATRNIASDKGYD